MVENLTISLSNQFTRLFVIKLINYGKPQHSEMKSKFSYMHSLLEVFDVVNLCDKLVFFRIVLTFCTSVNSN